MFASPRHQCIATFLSFPIDPGPTTETQKTGHEWEDRIMARQNDGTGLRSGSGSRKALDAPDWRWDSAYREQQRWQSIIERSRPAWRFRGTHAAQLPRRGG